MFEKLLTFIKDHALLLIVLIIAIVLITLFHEVMMPFLIALVVVYLMEPLVGRMNKRGIGKRKFPRWFAVILAYLVFFAAIVGIGFAFIPSLTHEISQATEAVPNYLTRVKNEDIPRWSSKLDALMFRLSLRSTSDVSEAVNASSELVRQAFDVAVAENDMNTLPTVDKSGAQSLLRIGVERENNPDRPEFNSVDEVANERYLFKFVKSKSSDEFYVMPGESSVILEPDSKGAYTLKLKSEDDTQVKASQFDLERELSRVAMSVVESSTQYAGSALSFLQYMIEFIVNTFVQFILVFMLAAFMSIDQPKWMGHLRHLFESPSGDTKTFDELIGRLSKGLGGVIRGQLLICCINGTLTGLGLWFFGVDFALLLGIVAGIMSIIPIFGTIISTIPCVLLGLVQGFSTAVLVLGWILIVHFCDTNFFTPKIVGSSASIHPVVIIFALLAGQNAAGAVGLIFAVPIASICQTLFIFAIEQSKKRKASDEASETVVAAAVTAPADTVVAPADTVVASASVDENLPTA